METNGWEYVVMFKQGQFTDIDMGNVYIHLLNHVEKSLKKDMQTIC